MLPLIVGLSVGLVTFLFLNWMGPPQSLYCDRSMTKHDWGKWEATSVFYQQRTCNKCGWTEIRAF